MTTARSDFEIRMAVRQEVTGLTYEQLRELISVGGDGADPADRHAPAVRMTELKRIRNLVSQQAFGCGYTPAGDQERGQGHLASDGVRPPEQRGLYQVLARCTEPEHPGASEVTNRATADSVEEAAVMVRRTKEGNLYGPAGLYRIVEVFEDTPSNAARHKLDALSQAAAETGQAAAAAAGAYEPAPEATGLYEVLTDFFHRTVVHPWHLAYPGDRGDGSTPQQPRGSDHGRTLARLLMAHLEALDMPLTNTTPPRPERAADARRGRLRAGAGPSGGTRSGSGCEGRPGGRGTVLVGPGRAGEAALDVALRVVRTEEREGSSAWRRSWSTTAPAWRSCCARTGRAAGPPSSAGTR
ncbi:hypothetical protein [Streptomyces sp. NPDC058623]|uniref:hypothetical protein n=1 Tax=Streptomyces sp. NPDC058623 TaxID=3346563 RepID=UPI003648E149